MNELIKAHDEGLIVSESLHRLVQSLRDGKLNQATIKDIDASIFANEFAIASVRKALDDGHKLEMGTGKYCTRTGKIVSKD